MRDGVVHLLMLFGPNFPFRGNPPPPQFPIHILGPLYVWPQRPSTNMFPVPPLDMSKLRPLYASNVLLLDSSHPDEDFISIKNEQEDETGSRRHSEEKTCVTIYNNCVE